MRHHNSIWLVLLAALWINDGALAVAADPPEAQAPVAAAPTLDSAFDAMKTYDWGIEPKVLNPIDDAITASHGNAAVRKDLEDRLTAMLKTPISRAAKDYVCRKLVVVGTAASVPALAELLPDKDQSHMARYALERITVPEAAQSLRDALPKLGGALKVGVIASLGARRDAASVEPLAALLGDADRSIAAASLCALGDIGNAESATVLETYAKQASEAMQGAVADALLVCAERLLADGKKAESLSAYKSLCGEQQPKHIGLAATRGVLIASAASGESCLQMILDLAQAKDREVRSLAFEQVREAAKGPEATQRFAALLHDLPTEAQVEMLSALAGRCDRAARPAVLAMCASQEETVRVAAIRALGSLGDTSDIPLLVRTLAAAESEEEAGATSLARLAGQSVNEAMVDAMNQAAPEIRVKLLDILATRHATDQIPAILNATQDANAKVREAAMEVLGRLAGPEQAVPMLRGVLRAEAGKEREAAERAVMTVCGRISDAKQRAVALLAAWGEQSEDNKTILLPTLGRVGNPDVLKVINDAMAGKDLPRRAAAIHALCNWPDATVVPQLTELAQTGDNADHRIIALRALTRVAVLRDDRTDAEKLDLLKAAMTMATRDEERALVLERARAIRSIESFRFVVPYMDQPVFAEDACLTVVELARHTKLREANKPEVNKALDTVIRISKDPEVIDRAKRYQKSQT